MLVMPCQREAASPSKRVTPRSPNRKPLVEHRLLRASTYFCPSPITAWEWMRRLEREFSSPFSRPRCKEKVQAWGSPPCTELSNRAADLFGWSQNPDGAPALKSIFHVWPTALSQHPCKRRKLPFPKGSRPCWLPKTKKPSANSLVNS